MDFNNTGNFKTACRGCHGGCVHILTVSDGRVIGIRPDKDAPLNQGKACAKGISIIEQMYHPARLRHPMKRAGPRGSGRWERITWDEALDTIAERLNTLKLNHGAECISTITGTGRHLVPYLWRFTKALGTPNITSAGALICLGPRKNAGFSTSGAFNCVDYYGDTDPACIVVWGANPTVSGADGELQWHPRRCVQRGSKLIVIDPRKTELAERADLWLRLRPGTDGALALGILNVIIEEKLYDHEFVDNWTFGFDELKARCAEYDLEKVSSITWVPKQQIIDAARLMSKIKPMSLEWGCAFEQGYNATHTCRAIYMLPAITGNYDIPGGFVESKHITPTKRDPIEPDSRLINYFPYRSLKPYAHPHQVLKAAWTGRPYRIRAMLSFANNSVISLPDSRFVYDSLKDLEFFVCMDVFMTPTAELSDIVLPAALWPEVDCVFCMPEFSEHSVLCQQKVAQVGECKSDEEVFIALCKRMGLDYGASSQHELIDTELEAMSLRFPEMKGLDFDSFKELGYFTPGRTYQNYIKRGGFNTPTGKFEFYSKEIEQLGGDPLPFWSEPPATPISRPDLVREYPYLLTTGARSPQYFISNNRQIKSLRKQYPFPLVSMHPDTASENDINEGDWVYIHTFHGRITQKAKLDPSMDPRVIHCDFGWWYPEAGAPGYGWDESNANILTSSDNGCDPYMGSYQLRSILCAIYKNENCQIERRYYESELFTKPHIDTSSDCIVIDSTNCILCGDCVETCNNIQSIGAIERGTRGITCVTAKDRLKLSDSGCVGCGQCRASCQTGALQIHSDIDKVKEALNDENSFVVAQLAPSVRVGVGGHLGFPPGENSMPLIIDALYRLGFNKVFDSAIAADLTAIEEADELLERLTSGTNLPLLTSCCPAWVKFCENRYSEFKSNISTCRSPQQMLGALIRDYYDNPDKRNGKRLVSVSITPCTAKKAEILRPESQTFGVQDIDYSVTVSELLDMLTQSGITAQDCSPRTADEPFSTSSNNGSGFGLAGGVTKAALSYILPTLDPEIANQSLTGSTQDTDGINKLELDYNGKTLKIAFVSGLANAARLMQAVKSGKEKLDLIEVMACPGGCIMGGGQPSDIYSTLKVHVQRSHGLSSTGSLSSIHAPQDNTKLKEIMALIDEDKKHTLLHRGIV